MDSILRLKMVCNRLLLDSYDESVIIPYRVIFNFGGIGISMLSTTANIRNYSSDMITKIETDY